MTEILKVLIIEDCASDSDLIQYTLKKSHLDCIFKTVEKRTDFENALQTFAPNVILSDHTLPDFNSRVALEIGQNFNPQIVFILVTGSVSEEFAVQSIQAGADDYVLKSSLTRLPTAIENAVKKKNAEIQKEKSVEKIKKSEEYYRNFFNKNPVPMWIIDGLSYKFLFVNEAAINHYGYSREEFLSMTAIDIRPDCERQNFISKINSLGLGPHKAGVWKHQKKDGSVIFVEVIVDNITIQGTEGKLILALDITENIEAHERLEQKNKELTKINTELDRFVYSTSHELRAPLSSILGLINLIQFEKNNKEKKGMLAMIKSRIERLDFIIKDILSYSKNTRLNVERNHVDLNELISKVLDDLNYMDEIKKITIKKEIPTNLSFFSDESRINIILNNLLSNAIKYYNTKQENPTILISAYETGDVINIKIKDNGCGIAEESKEKIFNMFYRATNVKEGSGLGLFIVKEFIDKLGGTVTVESIVNVGSEFIVSVPNLLKRNSD